MPLKSNIDQVVKSLRNKNSAVAIAVRGAMLKGMYDYQAYITKAYYSGQFRTGNFGLNRRSGALARSWHVKAYTGKGGTFDFKAALATSSPYARIHEYGGVIKAKNAKALAIPLNKQAEQTNPRSMKLFFMKGRFGQGMLFTVAGKGKNEQITPMYALRKSITIPKRTDVVYHFNDIGKRLIIARINTAIKAALKGGTNGSAMQ